MSEVVYVALKDLAVNGVTVDQLKYWGKLLKIRPVTRSRSAHVTAVEAETLRNVAAAVAGGVPPAEACRNIAPESKAVAAVVEAPRLENLERGILAVAEKFSSEMSLLRGDLATLIEENRRMGDDLRAVRMENALLRRMIEAPKPAPVVEKKEARADPREESRGIVPTTPKEEGFLAAVKAVQEWLRGVCSPFVEALKGS